MAEPKATRAPSRALSPHVLITDEDVADGREALARTFADDTAAETMLVDGFGVVVRVSRGQLECCDGVGGTRRVRQVNRGAAAAGRVRRVVVLGDGMVTTDAAAWCASMGVALVIAGSLGEPLMLGAPELYRHGGLRRAQALAPFTETGMAITRWLLERRLDDQARILTDHLRRPDRAGAVTAARAALGHAETPAAAMVVEMQAAEHYWAAWADEMHLRFRPVDRSRVPAHWTVFGGRSSPLGEAASNRHSAHPPGALLSLGFRFAEIEATIACTALGLDPSMGVLHADRANRPAFVLDLMETVRGLVEQTVWQLVAQRVFRKADFTELPTGQVRVVAPLTHDLAKALMPALREQLAPAAEHVAAMLTGGAVSDVRVPTTLTRERHKSARRADGEPARGRRAAAAPAAQLWTCPDCGGSVTDQRRVRCDACIEADPRQTPAVRGRRAKALAARHRKQAAWASGGGAGAFDPNVWPTIQTGLAAVRLADIMAATGVSKSFASTVRSGASRPHISLWPALAELAGVPLTPG